MWLAVALEVAAADAEALGDFLTDTGAVAVTLLDAGDSPVLEPAPLATPLWPQARVEALYPLDIDVGAVRLALDAYFSRTRRSLPPVFTRFIEAQDWSSTWREFSTPLDFGARLRIAPKDAEPHPTRVTVRLDPGMAFGTGSHATTALCLSWIAQHPFEGRRVVDFGCGSGILGIAALCLGAAHVTAVDHDPQARVATLDNAAYNGIGASALAVVGTDSPIEGPVDVVIANILADPLIELAPVLTALLGAGGVLVLSGMRLSQWPGVRAAYPAFAFDAPREQDEWIAVEGIRTGG